ncbi:MAG: hypothetical protein HC914_11745 [Chloroflexaceae bacterium]|nr:hypothetical protein [Chloroflexaceae bacterium]
MPVMINLTSAEHGGTATCGTSTCGPDCGCGCPYTGMDEKGKVASIAALEQCYPNEWLAFVIPPGEDEYKPERGMLVVHSRDDEEVWDAVARVTRNQVVHVYYNGSLDAYLEWADHRYEPDTEVKTA